MMPSPFDHYPVAIEAKESDYLYTGISGIKNAGNGLFTAIPIFPNEIIAVFQGRILSEEEITDKIFHRLDAYFINMPDGTTLDCMDSKCFAGYANDAHGHSRHHRPNNAIIALNEGGDVCLVATRKIPTGAEIFCGYGRQYWKKHT